MAISEATTATPRVKSIQRTALAMLAIAFISTSLFLPYVTSTCAWALSSVAAPTNCTASIGAMRNFGGYLGGALAPTVTGSLFSTPARSFRRWSWAR
jgi:hypothetical protein